MVIWGGKDIKTKESGLKINTDKPIKVRILPSIDVKSLPKGKKGREELENMVRGQMESEISNILSEV